MKHTPSAEELEVAIADVLEKSAREDLTAKEVRHLLQNNKKEWKVPGERRVAKFIKRQHSFKKEKRDKKGEGNGLFGLFKGERGKQNGGTKQEPDNNHPETNPAKQKKVGFRESVTRMLSPSLKNKKPNKSASENFEEYTLADADKPIIKAISEIEESSHYHVDPDDYDVVSFAQSKSYAVKPSMMPPNEEGESQQLGPNEEEEISDGCNQGHR